jgi:hypothetical protein
MRVIGGVLTALGAIGYWFSTSALQGVAQYNNWFVTSFNPTFAGQVQVYVIVQTVSPWVLALGVVVLLFGIWRASSTSSEAVPEPLGADEEGVDNPEVLRAATEALLPVSQQRASIKPKVTGTVSELYARWAETGDAESWQGFLDALDESCESLPRGRGGAEALSRLYPRAVGRPDFDSVVAWLESQ